MHRADDQSAGGGLGDADGLALSAVPDGRVAVPDAVRALARACAVTPVWRNAAGGLTFRLDDASGARYVKWAATGTPEIDFVAEADRLAWARQWAPVPEVIAVGADRDGAWLLTAAVPGRSAVDPRWLGEPATAAAAIGYGLRALHEALPVAACPFDWSVASRLAAARRRATTRPELGPSPAVDRPAICPGAAFAPNTLLHDDGSFAAHVDLDSLGVADRWADLAVAAWSTEWNYGPGYDGAVYAAYGVRPDAERISFYRALWAAT
jgi:kanamycin kinase